MSWICMICERCNDLHQDLKIEKLKSDLFAKDITNWQERWKELAEENTKLKRENSNLRDSLVKAKFHKRKSSGVGR